jgi:lactate dehydrogenase-like 2-hydroxyacid dehydrogenase
MTVIDRKFRKIVAVDHCGLTPEIVEKINELSVEPVNIYLDIPASDEEIIERISDADCVLVSWQTRINENVLRSLKSVKYIGMCCSLYDEKSANVDIAEARSRGIVVKGVRDYGDEGSVEFIFAQLIFLFKGMGVHKWRNESAELTNAKMGIIGFGTLGQLVARTALHFGMEVCYFSRTRKIDLETDKLKYLPLEEMMKTCDVVSTHLPRNTKILSAKEFRIKKKNSILINTSLGLTFDKDAFVDWIANDKTSYAIFDGCGYDDSVREFKKIENIIIFNQSSGFTFEARQRLSEKVVNNMLDFLGK